jgi:dephospho-CoA kinase
MLQVGLTGNIASGKSHASKKFAELGAYVIDADSLAHELIAYGTKTYQKIVEAFGKEILCSDGSIDRKVLGRIVFSDPAKRVLLNSLTHPVIGSEIQNRIKELERTYHKGIVVIEAPLMVEVGSYRKYHSLIVVTCSPSKQISRLIKRDNLTTEEAEARIRSQMPIEEKLKLADYCIDTSGSMEETKNQVVAIYKKLLEREVPERASST